MMGRLKSDQGQLFYEFRLGDAVPEDHLVRKIDAGLDLSWLRSELAPHYSSMGRPSIDPELMIRMLVVRYENDARLRHGRGDDVWIVGLLRRALTEKIAVGAPCFQSGFHRRSGDRLIEVAQRSLVGLQFSRHEMLPCTAHRTRIRRSVYLASREFPKQANSVAGPGYISTHPACRSKLSINPPQSTPMVAIPAFCAAAAS